MASNRILVHKKLKLRQYGDRAILAANTVLAVIARDLEGKAAEIIKRDNHVYQGSLFRDVKAERFEEDKQIGVKCFVGGASQRYAQVIHDQRVHPAKKPPFNVISEWVAKKLGVPKDDDSHYPIVQAIRSNIAKHGLKSIGPDGLQFFWNPLQDHYNHYIRLITSAVERVRV
jgi:hypothetical protein